VVVTEFDLIDLDVGRGWGGPGPEAALE